VRGSPPVPALDSGLLQTLTNFRHYGPVELVFLDARCILASADRADRSHQQPARSARRNVLVRRRALVNQGAEPVNSFLTNCDPVLTPADARRNEQCWLALRLCYGPINRV
jgi:hypothetical protein